MFEFGDRPLTCAGQIAAGIGSTPLKGAVLLITDQNKMRNTWPWLVRSEKLWKQNINIKALSPSMKCALKVNKGSSIQVTNVQKCENWEVCLCTATSRFKIADRSLFRYLLLKCTNATIKLTLNAHWRGFCSPESLLEIFGCSNLFSYDVLNTEHPKSIATNPLLNSKLHMQQWIVGNVLGSACMQD